MLRSLRRRTKRVNYKEPSLRTPSRQEEPSSTRKRYRARKAAAVPLSPVVSGSEDEEAGEQAVASAVKRKKPATPLADADSNAGNKKRSRKGKKKTKKKKNARRRLPLSSPGKDDAPQEENQMPSLVRLAQRGGEAKEEVGADKEEGKEEVAAPEEGTEDVAAPGEVTEEVAGPEEGTEEVAAPGEEKEEAEASGEAQQATGGLVGAVLGSKKKKGKKKRGKKGKRGTKKDEEEEDVESKAEDVAPASPSRGTDETSAAATPVAVPFTSPQQFRAEQAMAALDGVLNGADAKAVQELLRSPAMTSQFKKRYEKLQTMFDALKALRHTEPERALEEAQQAWAAKEAAMQRVNDKMKTEKDAAEARAAKATDEVAQLRAQLAQSQAKLKALQEGKVEERAAQATQAQALISVYERLTSTRMTVDAKDARTIHCVAAADDTSVTFDLVAADGVQRDDATVQFVPTGGLDTLPSFMQDKLEFDANQLGPFAVNVLEALYEDEGDSDEDEK